MGGAIVSAFVHNSPLAGRVRALILDAPVLDRHSVIDLQAAERGLPGFLATTVGVDGLGPHRLRLGRVRPGRSRPARRVTYHRIAGAGHVEAWNVGAAVDERRVRAFLGRVGA